VIHRRELTPAGRPRRLVLVLVAVLTALAGSLAALPSGSAAATPRTVTVWRQQSVCGTTSPNHARCDAVALVRTKVPASQVSADAADGSSPAPAAVPSRLRGPAHGYNPTALTTAYGVNPNSTKADGFTVAVVDACFDPNITADLTAFDAAYGLPAETDASFRVLRMGTKDGCSADEGDGTPLRNGWSVETALDVEAIRGVCHRCHILLVEAPTPSNTNLGKAVNAAAAYRWKVGTKTLRTQIISNSYGLRETSKLPASYASDFRHAGVAILAATGDDGWFGWDYVNSLIMPDRASQMPASLSTVVGVGGTRLALTSAGRRSSETIWNGNGYLDAKGSADDGGSLGATGGGCSTLVKAKPWQYGIAGYSSLGCAPHYRNSTDVAAVADPATGYDVYSTLGFYGWPSSHWHTVGGTSLATPVVAGIWALAGGTGGVANPAMTLYGHRATQSSAFYDVTVGGNGLCGSAGTARCAKAWKPTPNKGWGVAVDCGFPWPKHAKVTGIYQCRARRGYDGPSGVGTPRGTKGFTPITPTAGITKSGAVAHHVTKVFSGSTSKTPFPNGKVVSYHWEWGDGHHGTATHANVSHAYAKAGRYTIHLTVRDSYGQVSPTLARTITVR
jgi:hypothetical protein